MTDEFFGNIYLHFDEIPNAGIVSSYYVFASCSIKNK